MCSLAFLPCPSQIGTLRVTGGGCELLLHLDPHCSTAAAAAAAARQQQLERGPQSRRGSSSMRPMEKLKGNTHALEAFDMLFRNEEALCGDYAVFYHSYSWAALLYEVRAAIAAELFGFCSQSSPLPRLEERDFAGIPNAQVLMKKVSKDWQSEKADHKHEFRLVGISAMCSLVATGPECCLQVAFNEGYSCKRLDFRGLLESLIRPCVAHSRSVASLVEEIIRLGDTHGLDTSQFSEPSSEQETRGHILQIFVHRSLVDRLCYPAKPYGEVDVERLPFSDWMAGDHSFSFGQARLLAHPRYFMRPKSVRMFVVSASATFQAGRAEFQRELARLLAGALGDSGCRQRAIRALGGKPLSAVERAEATCLPTAPGL
mmetsp:Transcript_29046/g.79739  ORF Transcript_29046/g.79739 Transcript_29046/m.79739 type:complete len:374 (+) Transcript_29046:2446-3567(+)